MEVEQEPIWVVYHTTQHPPTILVEEHWTHQFGRITEFTEEEWQQAIHAPPQGYMWVAVERIEVYA